MDRYWWLGTPVSHGINDEEPDPPTIPDFDLDARIAFCDILDAPHHL